MFKKAVKYIFDKLDRLITAAFGAAGAVLLAQFPQFLTQYLQRLGGHIDEARLASSNYKLSELARRADLLKEGLTNILNAPPVLKLPKFITNAEWDIATAAYKNFTPGISFDAQGLYYMGSGIIAGLLLYGLIKIILKSLTGAISSKNKKKMPPPVNPPY